MGGGGGEEGREQLHASLDIRGRKTYHISGNIQGIYISRIFAGTDKSKVLKKISSTVTIHEIKLREINP